MASKTQNRRKKLLVVGLDGAGPDLVFERLKSRMPNLMSIAEKGVYGPLPSTDPPVTSIPSELSDNNSKRGKETLVD